MIPPSIRPLQTFASASSALEGATVRKAVTQVVRTTMPTVGSIREEAAGLAFPPIAAMLWEKSAHAGEGEFTTECDRRHGDR
jgi:hypothetical protein